MTITMERNDDTLFMVIIELHNHHRNVYDRVKSIRTKNECISIIYEDEDSDYLEIANYPKENVLNMSIIG